MTFPIELHVWQGHIKSRLTFNDTIMSANGKGVFIESERQRQRGKEIEIALSLTCRWYAMRFGRLMAAAKSESAFIVTIPLFIPLRCGRARWRVARATASCTICSTGTRTRGTTSATTTTSTGIGWTSPHGSTDLATHTRRWVTASGAKYGTAVDAAAVADAADVADVVDVAAADVANAVAVAVPTYADVIRVAVKWAQRHWRLFVHYALPVAAARKLFQLRFVAAHVPRLRRRLLSRQ